jgi:hypothetical protein
MHAVASCPLLTHVNALILQSPVRRQQIVAATSGQSEVEETQVDIEKIVDDLKERVRSRHSSVLCCAVEHVAKHFGAGTHLGLRAGAAAAVLLLSWAAAKSGPVVGRSPASSSSVHQKDAYQAPGGPLLRLSCTATGIARARHCDAPSECTA